MYADSANLLLSALYFHPLLPLSIPIGLVGFILGFWSDKVSSTSLEYIDNGPQNDQKTIGDVRIDGGLLRKPTAIYGPCMGFEFVLVPDKPLLYVLL